jgi:hypothetical protein
MLLAVASSSSTKALWYLTRATGLVSLILLTLVMVLGIAQIERWAPARRPRFVTLGLHRNASLLAVAFLGVHIISAVVDSYAPIDLAAIVLPFSSRYRPIWLGLGALAFDLLVALIATSLLRPRISQPLWRGIHWAAYACWPLAFVHGLGTGSDGRVGWVQVLDVACLAAILAAVAWRLVSNWQAEPAARLAGAIGGSLAALVVVAWAATGPTQAGWARKSGTPSALLASGATTTAPPTGGRSTSTTEPAFTVPRQATLDGTFAEADDGSARTVTITTVVSGSPAAQLRIVLEGQAIDDGGLAMHRGTVELGPAGHLDLYRGAVTGLDGSDLTAALHASGRQVTVQIHLELDSSTQAVTGTIHVD